MHYFHTLVAIYLVYLNLLSEEMIISNGDISGFDEDGMTTYQQEQSEIGYRYEITKSGKDFLRVTIQCLFKVEKQDVLKYILHKKDIKPT